MVTRDITGTTDVLEPGLMPEIDKEKYLDVYPVNEPYAYIGIRVNPPHIYEVCEISLSRA
jgi:hypothetical protein